MNGRIAQATIGLVLVASKAMASSAVAPWAQAGSDYQVALSSTYVPIAMTCVLMATVIAWWKFGDQEGWLGSLLKVGVGAAVAGNALAFVLYFMGAGSGVALGATLDAVQPTLDAMGVW